MEAVTTPAPDKTWSYTVIRTTLYDLIKAINAEAKPGEEDLVVPIVVHLLDASRVTLPRRPEHYN